MARIGVMRNLAWENGLGHLGSSVPLERRLWSSLSNRIAGSAGAGLRWIKDMSGKEVGGRPFRQTNL